MQINVGELKQTLKEYFSVEVSSDQIPALMRYALDDTQLAGGQKLTLRVVDVEAHLAAAETFLSRAIGDRATYDMLGEKALTQALTIEEFLRHDVIRQGEFDAGLHEVPYLEAVAAKKVHEKELDSLQESVTVANDIYDNYYNTAKVGNVVEDAGWSAWAGKYPYYSNPSRQEHPIKMPAASSVPGDDLADGMQKLAGRQMQYTLDMQQRQARLSKKVAQNRLDAEKLRDEPINKREVFLGLYKQYQADRAQVSKDIVIKKMSLICQPGSPINYLEQQRAVRQRIIFDTRVAYQLMQSAAVGLKSIFGLVLEPPPSEPRKVLDDGILWVRNARVMLETISASEQTFVAVISVKTKAQSNSERFLDGIERGWTFLLDESSFPTGFDYRVKGICIALLTEREIRPFVFKVDVPKSGWYVHQNGDSTDLDQTAYAPLHVGRVTRRDPEMHPDIYGAQVLRNLSPFGTWKLTVEAGQAARLRDSGLQDMEFELHVAFHSWSVPPQGGSRRQAPR